MGDQLIIIGCVGSFNLQLATELVKFLGERGLQIKHASNRYEGQTHFAVGTGADLAAAFEQAEIKTAFVEVAAPTEPPVTLQTILNAVNEGRKEARAFFRYEKNEDKKDGPPKPPRRVGKKEEGGAPPQAQEPGNDSPNPPPEKNEGSPPAEDTAPQPNTDVADDPPPAGTGETPTPEA